MANCWQATSETRLWWWDCKPGKVVVKLFTTSHSLEIGSFRGALDPQVSETHNYFLFHAFKQRILCWTLLSTLCHLGSSYLLFWKLLSSYPSFDTLRRSYLQSQSQRLKLKFEQADYADGGLDPVAGSGWLVFIPRGNCKEVGTPSLLFLWLPILCNVFTSSISSWK